jgi:hypothetical protein
MWWWSQASCWTVWEALERIQRTAAVRVQGVELRPQLRHRLAGEQPHDLDQLHVVRVTLPAVHDMARDAVACVRRSRLFVSRLRAPLGRKGRHLQLGGSARKGQLETPKHCVLPMKRGSSCSFPTEPLCTPGVICDEPRPRRCASSITLLRHASWPLGLLASRNTDTRAPQTRCPSSYCMRLAWAALFDSIRLYAMLDNTSAVTAPLAETVASRVRPPYTTSAPRRYGVAFTSLARPHAIAVGQFLFFDRARPARWTSFYYFTARPARPHPLAGHIPRGVRGVAFSPRKPHMQRKGVMAEPPSERVLRLTWRAWHGALSKMLCVMV